eukprot:5752862-Karenia_brevis.AAC.1
MKTRRVGYHSFLKMLQNGQWQSLHYTSLIRSAIPWPIQQQIYLILSRTSLARNVMQLLPRPKLYNHTCERSTRLRLLAHLSDSRRDTCWKLIITSPGDFQKLSEDQVKELDDADCEARREARRAGHTHAIAQGAATTCTGKVVGHVRH